LELAKSRTKAATAGKKFAAHAPNILQGYCRGAIDGAVGGGLESRTTTVQASGSFEILVGRSSIPAAMGIYGERYADWRKASAPSWLPPADVG